MIESDMPSGDESADAANINFEALAVPNGSPTWREQDLMSAMGYESVGTFQKAVTRAMQACLSLGMRTEDDFIRVGDSYKFTRFASYLIALNGDPKKPGVAAAQTYFAKLADSFQSYLEDAEGVDRLLIREEMTRGMKALHGTAKSHGVENYAFFQNEGYKGMYNMSLAELERFKGVPKKGALLDHMGKTELAANLFRVTQTDEKIKNERLRGQGQLERAAFSVGRKVRDTMQELGGTAPERLPLAEPVGHVRKKLKGTSKRLRELDGKKRTKPKPASDE
jgi:DNA-damage-inducible protein D